MDKQLLADTIQVLEELHSCDDPNCREDNCLHVLPRLRALLNNEPGAPSSQGEDERALVDLAAWIEDTAEDLRDIGQDERNAGCEDAAAEYEAQADKGLALLAALRSRLAESWTDADEELYQWAKSENRRPHPAPDATALREADILVERGLAFLYQLQRHYADADTHDAVDMDWRHAIQSFNEAAALLRSEPWGEEPR